MKVMKKKSHSAVTLQKVSSISVIHHICRTYSFLADFLLPFFDHPNISLFNIHKTLLKSLYHPLFPIGIIRKIDLNHIMITHLVILPYLDMTNVKILTFPIFLRIFSKFSLHNQCG